MGLLTCPDCELQVSEHADACPKCGCPSRVLLASAARGDDAAHPQVVSQREIRPPTESTSGVHSESDTLVDRMLAWASIPVFLYGAFYPSLAVDAARASRSVGLGFVAIRRCRRGNCEYDPLTVLPSGATDDMPVMVVGLVLAVFVGLVGFTVLRSTWSVAHDHAVSRHRERVTQRSALILTSMCAAAGVVFATLLIPAEVRERTSIGLSVYALFAWAGMTIFVHRKFQFLPWEDPEADAPHPPRSDSDQML